MKTTFGAVAKPRMGSYEATGVYRNATKTFKEGESAIIAIELCPDNVRRVRLHRRRYIAGEYMDHPMYVTEALFLDGTSIKQVISHNYTKNESENMGAAAVPARTKDVLDFGRLEQAVQSLMDIMVKVQATGTCTPEQFAAINKSRAGIREWKAKAKAQLAQAESSIDMAEQMVVGLLDLPA